MGLAAVSGQLIGGALVQANVAGLALAQLLLDQPADRAGRDRAGAQAGPRVARRALERARPRRHRAAHRWADGDRAAAGGRPPARLAGVDVGVAGNRSGDPARIRGTSAASGAPRRRTADRAGAVPDALVQRRAAHPAGVLVGPGVVLPGARAVPAAGARPQRAGLRVGVHDPRGLLRRHLGAGAGAGRAPRAAAAGGRSTRARRRPRRAAARPWRRSASAARSPSWCRDCC